MRGCRGAFKGGNFPEAEVLYNKAINVEPDATLYGNRAAGDAEFKNGSGA